MSGDFWTTVGGGSSSSQLPFTGKIGVFFVLMCMTLSNQGNTVVTEPKFATNATFGKNEHISALKFVRLNMRYCLLCWQFVLNLLYLPSSLDFKISVDGSSPTTGL